MFIFFYRKKFFCINYNRDNNKYIYDEVKKNLNKLNFIIL